MTDLAILAELEVWRVLDHQTSQVLVENLYVAHEHGVFRVSVALPISAKGCGSPAPSLQIARQFQIW